MNDQFSINDWLEKRCLNRAPEQEQVNRYNVDDIFLKEVVFADCPELYARYTDYTRDGSWLQFEAELDDVWANFQWWIFAEKKEPPRIKELTVKVGSGKFVRRRTVRVKNGLISLDAIRTKCAELYEMGPSLALANRDAQAAKMGRVRDGIMIAETVLAAFPGSRCEYKVDGGANVFLKDITDEQAAQIIELVKTWRAN